MGKKNNNKPKFKCKSNAQKRAIWASYARRSKQEQHISAPFPHFRYYRKSGHPTLIVGEQVNDNLDEEYRYRKVMHGDRDGRHLNEMVYPNPDPKDPDPMYIAKRVRHDLKDNFENTPLPWKYQKNE